MESLVSADWLQQNLDQVVVLDGTFYLPIMGKDAEVEFHKSHIPGALRWDINKIADLSSPLKHMMPEPPVIASAAGARGIGPDTQVVVYDQLGMFSAARVWLTFKVLGHKNVALLDGGLPAWKDESATGTEPTRQTVSGKPDPVVAVTYETFAQNLRTTDRHAVLAALDSTDTLVLDARAAGRFNAVAPEPVAGLVGGHMPGALNIPYDQLLDSDGKFLSDQHLRDIFMQIGVSGAEQLITSCGSGVTASIVTFALMRLGIESLVYDGSWSEWGQPDLGLPVV